MYTLIIIISLIGFILSFLLHMLGLFGYSSPRPISLTLQLGVLLIFLFWSFISKNVRGDSSKKDFNEFLWSVTPNWMKVTTGLIVIYSLFRLFNSLIARHTSGTDSISHGSFPSFFMALYAIMFMLFYSCKCLADKTSSEE